MYFEVKAFLFFDVVRHALIHFLKLTVDFFELAVDLRLTHIAVIKLCNIMSCHLLPAVIAVYGYVLCTELPHGSVG